MLTLAFLVLASIAFVTYDLRTKRFGIGTIRILASLVVVAVVLVYRALS